MKRILLTHIDLDALGCLLSVKYFKENFDKIWCCDYKDYEKEDFPYYEILDYDEIIFADFSPNQKVLDLVIENNIKMKVFDHHDSFYELYEENKEKLESLKSDLIEIYFDNKKSGTRIFYEYLSKGKRVSKVMKDLVEAIDTYDLYQTERENWPLALNLQRLLWKNYNWYDKEPRGTRRFSKFLDILYKKVTSQNNLMLDMYEKNAISDTIEKEKDTYKKAVSKMLIRTDNKGFKFGIIRVASKVSITAYNILKNYKDLDYLLIINTFKKDELKMSCRSRDTFNLLQFKLTKGLKQASGVKDIDNEFIEKIWNGKEVYQLEYNPDFVYTEKILEILEEKY